MRQERSSMKASFIIPARSEMLDAALYYDERRLGCGDRFLDAVEVVTRPKIDNQVVRKAFFLTTWLPIFLREFRAVMLIITGSMLSHNHQKPIPERTVGDEWLARLVATSSGTFKNTSILFMFSNCTSENEPAFHIVIDDQQCH